MAQVSRGALNQRNQKALEVQVALVGLTRLSVSFGLALLEVGNKANAQVVFKVEGYANVEVMKHVQALGLPIAPEADLATSVKSADVVVLDVPFAQQAEVLQALGSVLNPGAVILDFSPLKTPANKLADLYLPKGFDGKPEVYLVGVTPLIRMPKVYEAEGIHFATTDLFSKNDLIIVPAASIPAEAVKVASDLADLLDLKGRFMEPLEYDGLTGMSEMMPNILRVVFREALQSTQNPPAELPRFLSLLFMQGIQQSKGRNDILRTANGQFGRFIQPLVDAAASDIVSQWIMQRDLLLEFVEQVALAFDTLREAMKQEDNVLLDFIEATLADDNPYHPSLTIDGATPAELGLLWSTNRNNLRHHIEQMTKALETIRGVLMEPDAMVVEAFIQQVLDGFGEWEIRRRDNRWEEDFIGSGSTVYTSAMGGIVNTFFKIGRRKDEDKK